MVVVYHIRFSVEVVPTDFDHDAVHDFAINDPPVRTCPLRFERSPLLLILVENASIVSTAVNASLYVHQLGFLFARGLIGMLQDPLPYHVLTAYLQFWGARSMFESPLGWMTPAIEAYFAATRVCSQCRFPDFVSQASLESVDGRTAAVT